MANVGNIFLPDNLHYDKEEHLWLRFENEELTIGLDSMALEMVGELVNLDFIPIGTILSKGDTVCTLEAEKMVRPIKSPVRGTVTEHNSEVLARPLEANMDPYGKGWLVRICPEDWDRESANFVTGKEDVTTWLEVEVALYEAGQR